MKKRKREEEIEIGKMEEIDSWKSGEREKYIIIYIVRNNNNKFLEITYITLR